jgi:hypothetical protein
MNLKKLTQSYFYHTYSNGIDSKSTCNRTHDTFQETHTCITYIIKHGNDTYLLTGVKPPTVCRPSMNLPALDHTAHHAQQWVTPELGLNSIEQGNSRLGKDNKEVAQNNRKDLLSQEPLMPTTHRPSFPTCLLHPRRVHLH